MRAWCSRLPSSLDFRYPIEWYGSKLKGERRDRFNKLKAIVLKCISQLCNADLLDLLDHVEATKPLGLAESLQILKELIGYLRCQILSNDYRTAYRCLIITDVLVKNSGYRIHALINRPRFMKTISLIGRRYMAARNNTWTRLEQYRLGELAIDCVQAWGEAFYPREALYPNIYRTYMKLRYKHRICFRRPDFDPTRVPIFLGPVTRQEIRAAALVRDTDSNSDFDESDIGEVEEDDGIADTCCSLPSLQNKTDIQNEIQSSGIGQALHENLNDAGQINPRNSFRLDSYALDEGSALESTPNKTATPKTASNEGVGIAQLIEFDEDPTPSEPSLINQYPTPIAAPVTPNWHNPWLPSSSFRQQHWPESIPWWRAPQVVNKVTFDELGTDITQQLHDAVSKSMHHQPTRRLGDASRLEATHVQENDAVNMPDRKVDSEDSWAEKIGTTQVEETKESENKRDDEVDVNEVKSSPDQQYVPTIRSMEADIIEMRNHLKPVSRKSENIVSNGEDASFSQEINSSNVAMMRQRFQRKGSTYIPPSSDPDVEIRYYGHQRVVVKKSMLK